MTVAELVAKLGIDIDRQSWDKAEKGFSKLKSAAEGVVEALAIHKIKEGIDRMIEGTVESAHNVELLSQQLGISTDKVQEMAYAARSVGEGGLAMSLRQLANHAQNAARKGGEAGIVFSRLGVNIHGANGQLLPADQLLERVADGMQRVRNPTERMALATQLFGRNGVRMISVLKDGSEGLRKQYEMARKYGIMSKETIELAGKEHDAQVGVNYMTKALQNSIVEKLLPAKIWLLEKTQSVIEFFTDLARNTNVVKEAMVALSIVLGLVALKSFVAFLSVLGPIGVAILVIGGALWLVIDDLNSADSVLKHFGERWDAFVKDFANPDNVKPGEHPILTFLRSVVELMNEVIQKAGLVMNAMGIGEHFKNKQAAKNIAENAIPLKPGEGYEEISKQDRGFWKSVAGYVLGDQVPAYKVIKESMALESVTGTVSPSSQAAMGGHMMTVNNQGALTIHQTITAATGQDEKAVGEASFKAAEDAHYSYNEHALNQLVPLRGAAPAGG